MSKSFCPGERLYSEVQFLYSSPPPISLSLSLSLPTSFQLVLIPKYEELPGFSGSDSLAEHRRDEMSRYMCVPSFLATPMPPLAEMCTTLICSLSAIMHNGALRESTHTHTHTHTQTQTHTQNTLSSISPPHTHFVVHH